MYPTHRRHAFATPKIELKCVSLSNSYNKSFGELHAWGFGVKRYAATAALLRNDRPSTIVVLPSYCRDSAVKPTETRTTLGHDSFESTWQKHGEICFCSTFPKTLTRARGPPLTLSLFNTLGYMPPNVDGKISVTLSSLVRRTTWSD